VTSASLVYCAGATKAGTSWLYRYLHDHQSCHVTAVKEAHYWDTFPDKRRKSQIAAFKLRAAGLEMKAAKCEVDGDFDRAQNLLRQRDEMNDLISVLAGDRAGDAAYWEWLSRNAGPAPVVADVTPAYGLLGVPMLKRMADLRPETRFIYIMRDPLDRLWSNVRMIVSRESGQKDLRTKANDRLASVIAGDSDKGMVARSDYRDAVTKLQTAVPSAKLLTTFSERLISDEGVKSLCAFIGIDHKAANTKTKVHAGPAAAMDEGLAARAVQFLKEQYEWVAQNLGPLPQRWQDNLARAVS